ncbi:MAG: HAD-IA family hydrolase [Cyanobacteriota bacterium]|nr:HAD-IA family hydrolase [Cyanobacteriota bacterium]
MASPNVGGSDQPEPVRRSLQALLWDVDGTLAETERDGHRRAFNRAFRDAGVPLHWDREHYGTLLAISGGRERIGAALSELRGGVAPGPAELEALQTAKQRHYAALVEGGELRLRPGVAALITAAAQAGLRQAIVTTSGRPAVAALARCCLGPLADALELWVCGDDVGRKKPDPQGYQLALQRLGLPAGVALALEDSGNGLRAALGAGMTCVITLSHYGSREPEAAFAGASAVVDSLGPAGAVLKGPACGAAGVTLSYLQQLQATLARS